jgi:hypothetical protein
MVSPFVLVLMVVRLTSLPPLSSDALAIEFCLFAAQPHMRVDEGVDPLALLWAVRRVT